MKKYFYTDGTDRFGPFTLEELKGKKISRETQVWFHEFKEWKNAGTIPELQDLFTLIPPSIQKQNIDVQFTTTKAKANNTIEILVFISIVYWFIMNLANSVIRIFAYHLRWWYLEKFFQAVTNQLSYNLKGKCHTIGYYTLS